MTDWYDALAPGRETIPVQCYSLLRTIFAGQPPPARPKPLIPYNPAHIRGAGNTKRVHKRPSRRALEERRRIVEALPDRYKLMALLAAWCAMRFGELAELPPRRHRPADQPGKDHARRRPRRWRVHRRLSRSPTPVFVTSRSRRT